jgi:outer membrane protein assembly factor BamA
MYVSKQKLKQIKNISLFDKVMTDYGYNFHKNNPSLWTNEENLIYDIVSNVEMRVKDKVEKILTSHNNCYAEIATQLRMSRERCRKRSK